MSERSPGVSKGDYYGKQIAAEDYDFWKTKGDDSDLDDDLN
jgi:hypothetical protein